MVGRNVNLPDDDITKVPIPPVTGFCIGAVAGAVAWLVIYRSCPKPPVLDKILDWLFAGRAGPSHEQQRPTTTAMTVDGNDAGGPSRDDIELQDDPTQRPASPTETVETIMFGSEDSSPEPPMLLTSDEESD